jgi:hypothetical protein
VHLDIFTSFLFNFVLIGSECLFSYNVNLTENRFAELRLAVHKSIVLNPDDVIDELAKEPRKL